MASAIAPSSSSLDVVAGDDYGLSVSWSADNGKTENALIDNRNSNNYDHIQTNCCTKKRQRDESFTTISQPLKEEDNDDTSLPKRLRRHGLENDGTTDSCGSLNGRRTISGSFIVDQRANAIDPPSVSSFSTESIDKKGFHSSKDHDKEEEGDDDKRPPTNRLICTTTTAATTKTSTPQVSSTIQIPTIWIGQEQQDQQHKQQQRPIRIVIPKSSFLVSDTSVNLATDEDDDDADDDNQEDEDMDSDGREQGGDESSRHVLMEDLIQQESTQQTRMMTMMMEPTTTTVMQNAINLVTAWGGHRLLDGVSSLYLFESSRTFSSSLWRRRQLVLLCIVATVVIVGISIFLPLSATSILLFVIQHEDPTLSNRFLKVENIDSTLDGNVDQETQQQQQQGLCIPGGGFPGFWFTLGQLQSMNANGDDVSSHDYYCYSAGCLCVVAFLAELSFDQALDLASHAQGKWQRGEISRFEVVPLFVEEMIEAILSTTQQQQQEHKQQEEQRQQSTNVLTPAWDNSTQSTLDDDSNTSQLDKYWWIRKLHFITGERDHQNGGLMATIRTPLEAQDDAAAAAENKENANDDPSQWVHALGKALIQSAWIPGATGDTLFHDNHIDGGFVMSKVRHKVCQRTVEAVWNGELLWHCFNANLSREQALYFWQAGLEHGP